MVVLTLKAKNDHLQKVATTRDPIKALAEFVWNALDADATVASVILIRNDLGGLQSIQVKDNGTGISRSRAEHDFESLGESWKLRRRHTAVLSRAIHGKEGLGRLRFFSLAHKANWTSVYDDNSHRQKLTIQIDSTSLQTSSVSESQSVEAGTPNTLDHYLPQAIYPHFCILPANLVPACDICQGHKLEKVVGPKGRLFIHPYFDTWIQDQIVRLHLKGPYNAPSPSLACHPTLDGKHATVVEQHLSTLAIEKRFWAFFRKEYIRLLKLVGRARQKEQDVVDIMKMMVAHAADRSLNSWEHILFEGVLNDSEAMDYLQFGSLPLFN